jgi:mxaJ protein
VWGPLAGYFAARQSPPLTVTPVTPAVDRVEHMPLAFEIGVGVSRQLKPLRDEIDAVLQRRRVEIGRLLDAYHLPRVDYDS